MLLFSFLGLCCAAIIHGTFVMWEVFHQFAKKLPSENVPTFDPYSAYSVAYVLCSFILCNGALFGIFLGSKLVKIISYSIDLNHGKSWCSHLIKFSIIFKDYIIIHKKNLVSQLILFIILMTTKFSDLIQLLNLSLAFWTEN